MYHNLKLDECIDEGVIETRVSHAPTAEDKSSLDVQTSLESLAFGSPVKSLSILNANDDAVENLKVKQNASEKGTEIDYFQTSVDLEAKYSSKDEREDVTVEEKSGEMALSDYISHKDSSDEIQYQVEQIFSNANLLKDKFLLRHVRRNKDGYVNLKLVVSLRRVRCLTKDWKEVVRSLENSKILRLSPEKTKVRRVDPVPETPIMSPTKILIANLPEDICTVEDLGGLMRECGEIVQISFYECCLEFFGLTFPSRRSPPAEKNEDPAFYAVVEFATADGASKATLMYGNGKAPFLVWPYWKESVPKDSKESPTGNIPLCETEVGVTSKTDLASRGQADADGPLRPSRQTKTDSPWRLKRQSTGVVRNAVIVLRQPRGPDGTVGFHAGRSKANLTSPKIQ